MIIDTSLDGVAVVRRTPHDPHLLMSEQRTIMFRGVLASSIAINGGFRSTGGEYFR